MRTTLDIDDPILRALKQRQRKEGKTLGRLVSDLLGKALAEPPRRVPAKPFRWKPKAMGMPRVDLLDKDAVADVLDHHARGSTR